MSRLTRMIFHVVIIAVTIGFGVKTTKAQDAVQVDPEHYKVLYENDDVRVLRYDDTPGHYVPKHSHPQYAVYVLSTATRKFFPGNCASSISPKPVVLKPGPAFLKPPTTHCEANSGKTDTHLIIVEFKKLPATATAAPQRRPDKSFNRKRRRPLSHDTARLGHV